MKEALTFIITTLTQLYLFILLLRFWLPWVRADFSNPIAQGIMRFTSALVVPLRRVIPSVGRVDTATVIVALAIQYLLIVVVLAINSIPPSVLPVLITAALDLAMLSLRLFVFAIFIRIILSWVAPATHNPAVAFITMLVEPVLRPFRRFIPPIGGFDISPIFAIVLLQAASILIAQQRPIPI